MTNSDEARFVELLTGAASVKRRELTRIELSFYFRILRRFSYQQIDEALPLCLERLKFFPEPAEIIETIEGSASGRANRAWAVLLEALEYSAYSSALFHDGAMVAAMDAVFGGWLAAAQEIHDCEPPMVAHHRNHFVAQYTEARWAARPTEMYRAGKFELSLRAGSLGDHFERPLWQPVLIISLEGVNEVRLPFDGATGRLLPAAAAALFASEAADFEAREGPRLKPLLELPPGDTRQVTPEMLRRLRGAQRLLAAGSKLELKEEA